MPLRPNQIPLDIHSIEAGYFYRAAIVFPVEVDEASPLSHHHTSSTGRPPIFKGYHFTRMGQRTGLYRVGYTRTVCVTKVSYDTVTLFVCSSAPQNPANRANTHRWVAVDGAPVHERQPPEAIRVSPAGSLTRDASKAVYMCFTHHLEVTPIGQVEPQLPPGTPGSVHLSVPYQERRCTLEERHIPTNTNLASNPYVRYMIKCLDFARLLNLHEVYWQGRRYDQTGAPIGENEEEEQPGEDDDQPRKEDDKPGGGDGQPGKGDHQLGNGDGSGNGTSSGGMSLPHSMRRDTPPEWQECPPN
jgi:hypothetical protein